MNQFFRFSITAIFVILVATHSRAGDVTSLSPATFQPTEATDVYFSAVRVIDHQEQVNPESSPSAFLDFLISSGWASEKSCLLAGWEGDLDEKGHCNASAQNGYKAARAKCAPDTESARYIACNPSLFSDAISCVSIAPGNNRWTLACANALIKKAGGSPEDFNKTEHSSTRLKEFFKTHPETVRVAIFEATKICGLVSNRALDHADCEKVQDFFKKTYQSSLSPKKDAVACVPANGASSVLGSAAGNNLEETQAALKLKENGDQYLRCEGLCKEDDSNPLNCSAAIICRNQLLESEMKKGLPELLAKLDHDPKSAGPFVLKLRDGRCELNLSTMMIKPFDENAGSSSESKLKAVKTLSLSVQNENQVWNFIDSNHANQTQAQISKDPNALKNKLKSFGKGGEESTAFHQTLLQDTYQSCFKIDDPYRKAHGIMTAADLAAEAARLKNSGQVH